MSLLVDHPLPFITRLRINRPDKRNAIDFDVRQAMLEALQHIAASPECRGVVLGGVDGVFSAGGDLGSMGGLDEHGARARMQHIHTVCLLLAELPVPVVCAVEGYCAGAAVGMSLLSDYIVVGNSTKIIFPFMGLGLVPDWGAMLTLPRRVGPALARRLMTEGRVTTGAEAFAIGLADEDVGDGDIMAAAIAKAEILAKLPGSAFAQLKQRLANPSVSLREELQREETVQCVLLQGAEFNEGYRAVMEKRKPDFTVIKRESI